MHRLASSHVFSDKNVSPLDTYPEPANSGRILHAQGYSLFLDPKLCNKMMLIPILGGISSNDASQTADIYPRAFYREYDGLLTCVTRWLK
jgi:hypothetical protein